jgi:2-polyprenyl-3-methyl-5-hydroxy-6-metoxy-1,4-benzoquinol methylase
MRYTLLKDIYNIYIFGGVLLAMLKTGDNVLELGCGRNSLLLRSGIIKRMNVTGVDIFKPYVDSHLADGIYRTCICADATEIDFKTGEFDAVVCMDVLEHITKDRVVESKLLSNMQKWGRKVIITTPNGYVENDISDATVYHLVNGINDGNIYQGHQSGWSIEELKAYGYKVRGLSGWKKLRKENSQLRYESPYLFWAGVSLLSEVVTYFIPKLSYHLLATYEDK